MSHWISKLIQTISDNTFTLDYPLLKQERNEIDYNMPKIIIHSYTCYIRTYLQTGCKWRKALFMIIHLCFYIICNLGHINLINQKVMLGLLLIIYIFICLAKLLLFLIYFVIFYYILQVWRFYDY